MLFRSIKYILLVFSRQNHSPTDKKTILNCKFIIQTQSKTASSAPEVVEGPVGKLDQVSFQWVAPRVNLMDCLPKGYDEKF